MDKAALEALIDVLDKWATFFTLLVVIGVGGELVVHIKSSRTSKRLIALQHEEEKRRETEIARLTTEAERARRERAAADLRIAEAQQRAAEANQKAEEERLARLKIEEKLAPRHMTADQQQAIAGKLKAFAGQKLNVFVYASDQEVVRFANSLIPALQSAGWVLSVSAGQEGAARAVPGMLVEFRDGASAKDLAAGRALVEALSRERFGVSGPAEMYRGASGLMGSINEDPTAALKLIVGHK